eukprot:TRINITY_DN1288_c0_g1_i1.p1 TRINITY_DN1288_c0_g1~~TRINITY_DN1288_c0_g1_i1.p1  ORF type:complete len:64 (+),score=8.56 TRINITY_DN1288_c0_g1_i1:178-369(+)
MTMWCIYDGLCTDYRDTLRNFLLFVNFFVGGQDLHMHSIKRKKCEKFEEKNGSARIKCEFFAK